MLTAQETSRKIRRLKRYQSLGLGSKIRYSLRLVEQALAVAKKPIIAWSGGKDSTAMLHLIRTHFSKDIDVIFNNTRVEFPETLKFVRRMQESWGLNLHTATPDPKHSFWWCVENYGWPLFGKAGAGRIDTLRNGGEVSLNQSLRRVAETDVPISARCCRYLKERPMSKLQKRLEVDLVFLGIMSSESRRRKFNWADHGDFYQIKSGEWRCLPLSIWTTEDVWKYHERYDIPHCPLYDMGHRQNGCWPCTMDIYFKDNHLKALRASHPKLWKFLVVDKGLGEELVKIKLALNEGQYNLFSQAWSVEKLIEQRPCFFDAL